MGQAKRKQAAQQAPVAPRKSPAATVAGWLASVKFAVVVVIIIAAACVVGTLLPQGADVAKYLQQNPAAQGRMDLFRVLGLTHVFYSWWFVALLCTLAASVATCSTRRFATIRRTRGFARRRALGSMLTHISILLILGGGVIRAVWGEKGYLEFREGQTVAQFVGQRGVQPLPFGLHLAKFEIETYNQPPAAVPADDCSHLLVKWPAKQITRTLNANLDEEQVIEADGEAYTLKVLQYIPDFTVDMATKEVSSRSAQPNNPAILVAVNGPTYANHRWLFAKFPDFVMHTKDGQPTGPSPFELRYINHAAAQAQPVIDGPIKSFRSSLKVVENNAVAHEQQIEVNSPMQYKGYRFYQSGYNPRDLSYTSLQVVKDPGVPVVYAGFGLMIIGLFIVFYLNPWMDARRNQA